MEIGRSAQQIIDEWRQLERELEVAQPQGAQRESIEVRIEGVRRAYQRVMAIATAQAHQLHAPSSRTMRRVARSAEVSEQAGRALQAAPERRRQRAR